MSDTPDFDSMSPEEMMEWMESLAKRQGAAEGFTTNASMDVEEVDEADERLAGMGEYKPYGMSDEEWARMQEREAAEKATRLANQQSAPTPEPVAETPEPVIEEPEPEPIAETPVAAAPAEGEMPDFDSMSPEEMMEWMESLAKRQGAAEGFTTSASMQVAEVDEADERLAGMGEYKPYGMSDEEWARMQEREAAEKAARLANQQSAPTPEPVAEEPDLVDEEPEYTYEDDEDYIDDDEEFFETAEDSEEFIAAVLDMDDTQEDEPLPSFDDILPAETEPVAENPMDWLEGLSAGDDDMAELDLGGLDALGDLAGGESAEVGDPMAWLSSLSDGDDDGAPDLSALVGDDQEGSLEWMESLAADEGVDSEELVTDANLDIPMPESLADDGPGYEDFSFEQATGMVQDTESVTPASSGHDELQLDDPEGWLDALASGEGGGEIPDGFFDSDSNEIPDDIFNDPAFASADDDEIVEFDDLADNVKAQMETGKLGDSPEDVAKFFGAAFDKAATRTDVPDYLDDDDDNEDDAVDEPIQAEIPDWLQESMTTAPVIEEPEEVEPISKTATGEMMAAALFDDNEIEEAEIPDWLQSGSDEDTGAIDMDIFDDAMLEEAEADLSVDVTETQDTWVDAFSREDSPELKQWYDSAVSQLEDGEDVAIPEALAEVAATDDVTLAVADLPIERKLDEGSPQNVPDWMSETDSIDQSVEVEAVQNDMSWLGEDFDDEEMVASVDDDIDMPDWLQATVDDSVTADADLPDWLGGETDIAADEIPDWLRETMDEEEESVSDALPAGLLDDEPVAPAPTPLPVPVQQSPAPVPVQADKVDAVAYLRSAKDKISANDIEGAMLDYEQVIRANKALSQVEKELQRLAEDKSYKRNPAVNRVLGDVLMRQGKLQEALDTYRRALNML